MKRCYMEFIYDDARNDNPFSAMWAFNRLPTERIICFNCPSALRALEIKLGHLFYVLSLPSIFQIEYDAPRQY